MKFLTLPYFLNIQIPTLCFLHFVPLGLDPQALGSPGTLIPSPHTPVFLWLGLPWLVPQVLGFGSRVLETWLMLLFLPALGSLICLFAVCTSWQFARGHPVPMFSSTAQESHVITRFLANAILMALVCSEGWPVHGRSLCAGNHLGPSSAAPTPAQQQLPDESLVSPAHGFLASKWAVSTHLADCAAKRLGFQL